METKSEEYAAYRFHRKARLMCRIMFFYNVAHGNYFYAFVYHLGWTWETLATAKHKARYEKFANTSWGEKKKGLKIRGIS